MADVSTTFQEVRVQDSVRSTQVYLDAGDDKRVETARERSRARRTYDDVVKGGARADCC